MLVAALAVGLLAAYYLGVRAGGFAAVGAALLLLAAMVIPSIAWPAYLIVGGSIVALVWIGPRLRRKASPSAKVDAVYGWAKKRVSKLFDAKSDRNDKNDRNTRN